MTTEPQEPQWLAPDPVAVVREWVSGKPVVISIAGGEHLVYERTQLHAIRDCPYRNVPMTPKTYTNLLAAEAYFISDKWVFHPFINRWVRRFGEGDFDDPISAFFSHPTGWLVRDDDPRGPHTKQAEAFDAMESAAFTPVPRQVDVHEALRVYMDGGDVRDPTGMIRSRRSANAAAYRGFVLTTGDIGKPWTVLDDPPT